MPLLCISNIHIGVLEQALGLCLGLFEKRTVTKLQVYSPLILASVLNMIVYNADINDSGLQ